jgi:hypothetical protein
VSPRLWLLVQLATECDRAVREESYLRARRDHRPSRELRLARDRAIRADKRSQLAESRELRGLSPVWPVQS